VAERFVSSRPALVHGELLSSVPTEGTGPETLVKRNESIIHQLRVEEDRVTLLFGGKAVSFPSFVEPALRYISQNGEFRVAALPGNLDEPGKVTLARRLLAEGFLTVV
ncbi:MAG TPA: hypothetical protein VER55_13540, partial [Ardenticatenaceae bacterium]|nr:hypothetical protein [Ardenticatenaceae bacterium]